MNCKRYLRFDFEYSYFEYLVILPAPIFPFSSELSVAYIKPGNREITMRPASVPVLYLLSTPSVLIYGLSFAELEFKVVLDRLVVA